MTAPVPYCPSNRESRADRRKMVCLQIAPDGSQSPAQFLPVASVAFVAKTAEPLVAMGEAQTTVRVRSVRSNSHSHKRLLLSDQPLKLNGRHLEKKPYIRVAPL